MRVVVTDANIFIDLMELELMNDFFQLELEIHTTYNVVAELFDEQRAVLEPYSGGLGRLKIHNLTPEEIDTIHRQGFPSGLSIADQSVLYMAIRLDAILLTSDKLLRKVSGKRQVEYHGLLWIMDRLVGQKTIAPLEAVRKLNVFMGLNPFYNNNPALKRETENRIRKWTGL